MAALYSMLTVVTLAWLVVQEGRESDARLLVAHFNMGGVVGHVTLSQGAAEENVTVSVDLEVVGDIINVSWALHPYPVTYDRRPLCDTAQIGKREIDLTDTLGPLLLPASGLNFTVAETLSLWGARTVWGMSLVLEGLGSPSCANLDWEIPLRSNVALFRGPVAGTVAFRRPIEGALSDTLVFVDLFHVGDPRAGNSEHQWRILATDVLATRQEKEDSCDRLLALYDPTNQDDRNCSRENPAQCKAGELGKKHGHVPVGKFSSIGTRRRLIDPNLLLPSLSGSARRLFLVLYDKDFPDSLLACAKVVDVKPRHVLALVDSAGVKGSVQIRQESAWDAALVSIQLHGLGERAGLMLVHEFPVAPRVDVSDDICSMTGKPFNPFEVGSESLPEAGHGTYEAFPVGDLSGKYGPLAQGTIDAEVRDPYVTLFGRWTVGGRSLVLAGAGGGGQSVCSTLEYTHSLITAEAKLYYPVSGRVVFQQLADDPVAETAVHVEGFLYVDEHVNTTEQHRWAIHSSAVGKDFLNWTARCASAKGLFNPFSTGVVAKSQANCGGHPLRCAAGDLARKAGKVRVAARRRDVQSTRTFHVDINLPLQGKGTILGKTFLIHDDLAPAFRGNRLVCSIIRRVHPLHGAVTAWFSADLPVPIVGRVNVAQTTLYTPTRLLLDITGLDAAAGGFHIHEVPVNPELDFPCSADAVQDHFNPFNWTAKLSPPPGMGSADQYEVGDLSGKFGALDGEEAFVGEFTDPVLPLHGTNSVLGRSLVIHKRAQNARWTCGTLEVEDPEDAQHIHALASFHLPNGFVNGYVRMSQLIFSDGGSSPTWLEVKLTYPGKNNKNRTSGHLWSVFVNPVGYDATVAPQKDRCVAAGYKWNPYLIMDAMEEYSTDCSQWTPLRCLLGDVSGRQGPLEIGGKRRMLSDINLPLTGYASVMGRSIVIFDQKGSEKRFACANIQPEKRLVNVITIKNPRRFSSVTFMDAARDALGVPPWMMFAEAKKSREVLEGACVQVTVHFRGPDVERIQHDLTVLLTSGRVRRYTPLPPGTQQPRFGYKTCRSNFNSAPPGNEINNKVKLLIFLMLPLSLYILRLSFP